MDSARLLGFDIFLNGLLQKMEDGMDESQVLATVAWVMDRQLPTTHYHRPQGLGGQSSWRRLDMFHKGLNLEWGHYPLLGLGLHYPLPTVR